MLRIRWTGFGCLSLVLFMVILFVSIYIGYIFTGGDHGGNTVGHGTFNPVILLIGAGVLVLLGPLHWLLGWMLNSERMPSGRRWHNQHTLYDMPVQYLFIPQLVFALIFASGGLGLLTSALYGWLLFGGGLVVLVIGLGAWRTRVDNGKSQSPLR